jgi:hypothetical protein
MPLVLLGRGGEVFLLVEGSASGATAVTALVIADAARRGTSDAARAARISSPINPVAAGLGPNLA